jgi:hypothetical protein
MAKTNEQKTAASSVAKTSGLGSRDWRGHTVWFCLTPGCVADSEVKANIERHIKRGKHRIAGKVVKTAPRGQEVPTPVVADDDDDQDGDD